MRAPLAGRAALGVGLALVVVGLVPVAAHHPFARTYVESREITVDGHVVRWEYREPHSFVHLLGRRGDGAGEIWIVEWRGAADLRRRGVTLGDLRAGQRVIVTGSPGRVAADNRLRLRAIVRPEDGWTWREDADR